MKIMHIIDSLGLGGAQIIVKGILEYEYNKENVFLFSLRERNLKIEIKNKKVFCYRSNSRYSILPLLEIKKFIIENKIDVIHCHLFRSQLFGWILKKLFFPEIKLLFHEHGEILQNHKIYNLFIKKSKDLVDKYIAVSKTAKNELIRIGGISSKKISLIYNFIDLKKFSSIIKKEEISKIFNELNIAEKYFIIGFIGRLDKIKGCQYLINSLNRLDFDYRCLIVGDGNYMNKLKKLVNDLNLRDKVIFTGYRKDTEKFYNIMNVLIVPSEKESFGLSLIEGEFSGLPIICSNIPAFKEISSKNTIFFNSKDSIDLSNKLNYFYKSRGEFKPIKKNFNQFSIDLYVKKLNEIYNNLK